MAAIGRIRKHGVALMIIIGIALLAFIVGDLTNVINPFRNRLAKIGDKTITMTNHENEYGTNYNQNRQLFELVQPVASDEEFDQQVHDFTWQQIKHEAMLDAELAKVGLAFSTEMIENMNEQLVQSLKAQPTTQAEYLLFQVAQKFLQQGATVEQVMGAYQNINDYQGQPIYDTYKAIERIARIEAKENAYFGLATNGIYFSKKLLTQMAKDDKAITTLITGLPINSPKFDNLKIEVSDSEAEAFFKAHKDRYTQNESSRIIDMVVIPVEPTDADMAQTKDTVAAIYNRFQAANDINAFAKNESHLDRTRVFSRDAARSNTSNIFNYNYKTAHFAQVDTLLYLKRGETALQKFQTGSPNPINAKALPAQLDSFIFSHTAGTLIEPALYDNIYYFGKVRDFSYRPDSIQVAAITVAYKTEKNTKATLTKEQAQQTIDSLMNAMSASDSVNIYSFFAQYRSPYLGSDSTLWLTDITIDTIGNKLFTGLMEKEVGQYYIDDRDDFGMLTIFQVTKKSAPQVKCNYVLYPVPIQPSSVAEKGAKAKATEIAGKSNDLQALAKVAKENAMDVMTQEVRSMQGVIYVNYDFQGNPSVGLMCRQAISWAFEEDKDALNGVGQVSRAITKGKVFHYEQGQKVIDADAYVICGVRAIITAKKPKFEEVKELVIEDVKAEKKVQAIEAQLTKELASASIEQVAAKYEARVDTATLNFSQPSQLEGAVLGKIAGLPADKKAHVVAGQNAVYLVAVQKVADNDKKVDVNTYESAALLTTINRTARNFNDINATVKQQVYNDIEKNTKITDRRHVYYKAN